MYLWSIRVTWIVVAFFSDTLPSYFYFLLHKDLYQVAGASNTSPRQRQSWAAQRGRNSAK